VPSASLPLVVMGEFDHIAAAAVRESPVIKVFTEMSIAGNFSALEMNQAKRHSFLPQFLLMSRQPRCSDPPDRVAQISRLDPSGRLGSYRAGKLGLAELSVCAARYPDEVPMVNGEIEWIGLTFGRAGLSAR
jgi:hypothetical protein